MIQIDSVTRSYGDFAAVDSVSFEIGKGEIVGLLGHNGAGKTTIMKMVTGFLEPSAGSIRVKGEDVTEQGLSTRRLIGYLPENCPIYRDMTVLGYLEYCAALHDIDEAKRPTALRRALERTELSERALSEIGTLSRGLRQRVGVAQAILHEPEILILDEPTNGLDPTQIQHMRALIRSLAEQATVILSTHILQEVQAVCDRVIILRRGHKVLDDRLENLRAGARLLIDCDATPQQANELLIRVEGVAKIENLGEQAGFWRYALSLDADHSIEQTAPEVARSLVGAGLRLQLLNREGRDLETIFGEIANA